MNELEHISTDNLIAELRNRAKALFVAMRPLADHKDFSAVIAMGVDGRKVETADDRDHCIGLAYQAMQYATPKSIED